MARKNICEFKNPVQRFSQQVVIKGVFSRILKNLGAIRAVAVPKATLIF